MEKEPLIQPPPPLLIPLPEDEVICISPPALSTPSSLKDRLIFGPRISLDEPASESLIEALSQSYASNAATTSLDSQQQCGQIQIQQQPNEQQRWLFDPNYSLTKKTNLHRSRTAPAMAAIDNTHNNLNLEVSDKPYDPFSPQLIVKQAFVLLIVYLSLGVVIYWVNRHQFSATETHPVVDALYFCIVTMCTIGYGDITPTSTATKLFSVLFVLVGFGFIDILLSGMVSYMLDLQESHLLKTVKAGKDSRSIIVDVKKGRMRIRMKVGLALGVVVLCIGIGVGVMHFVEQLGWLDSFYLSVMSVTTVGYGDTAFRTLPGRIFASIWLLVSTLAVARAFLYLAEARVDKRHRTLAKWVLGQDLTVAQFLAADIDHNGFVSKSEFVIYKLKEMGKVSEKDILQICKKFEELDNGNNGKITLTDLMHSHR